MAVYLLKQQYRKGENYYFLHYYNDVITITDY